MNNTCPTCGAVYNVTSRDVGRRIRCKKCQTSLTVATGGLELDEPTAALPSRAAAPAPAGDFDDVEVDDRPRRRPGRGGMSFDPMKAFRDFGGVPSLLFGFGAFLVIVFLFQPVIGAAAVSRAEGTRDRMDLEWAGIQRKMEKDEKKPEEIKTAREKFFKEHDREKAEDNVGYERVSTKRSRWFEMYGMMFGFLFLMAGSLGYMMPEQTTVRRILGTVVLGTQMLIIFMVFGVGGGGCAGPKGLG